jgi:hypothetical protein
LNTTSPADDGSSTKPACIHMHSTGLRAVLLTA